MLVLKDTKKPCLALNRAGLYFFVSTDREKVDTGEQLLPVASRSHHFYPLYARRLQNAPFCPISASGSNFNPQNTQCIPVVKIFTFLELEQK
jgi:hypothetical protein